ncbi:hypothetical protein J6590_028848 [Homalodisca vitripennis]|nr:hypothetical protein J6590_028848 [Homalodisca vitripennis]
MMELNMTPIQNKEETLFTCRVEHRTLQPSARLATQSAVQSQPVSDSTQCACSPLNIPPEWSGLYLVAVNVVLVTVLIPKSEQGRSAKNCASGRPGYDMLAAEGPQSWHVNARQLGPDRTVRSSHYIAGPWRLSEPGPRLPVHHGNTRYSAPGRDNQFGQMATRFDCHGLCGQTPPPPTSLLLVDYPAFSGLDYRSPIWVHST